MNGWAWFLIIWGILFGFIFLVFTVASIDAYRKPQTIKGAAITIAWYIPYLAFYIFCLYKAAT